MVEFAVDEEEAKPLEKTPQYETDNKKVIKEGEITIKVTNLNVSKRRVDSLVGKYNAYYANENYYNYASSSEQDLSIKIPNQEYEKFISALESGTGEVRSKTIRAQDVTAQYVDLEIRLNNKKNYLKRYNEILKQAKTIEEILEIEEKNRVLEEEIEATEGQLKYLSDRVAYSALKLRLTEEKEWKYIPESRTKFGEELKISLSGGWYGLIDFFLFLIKIWPFWIVLALILFSIRKVRQKRKKKIS
jgi:hypothetical protein